MLLTGFWTDFPSSVWNFCRWVEGVPKSSRNVPQRRRSRRNVCRSQATFIGVRVFFFVITRAFLLGTYYACQFVAVNIRNTRYTVIAISLHWVQQCSICVTMATRDGLSININAHKFAGMVVTIVRCHQIPVVIPGPSRGTLVRRRDHHLGTTWLDVTHGARSILVIKIFAKAWEIVCLILCAVYRSCPLPALDVFVIDRVVGKTNKIRASTMVPIITTSHYTYQNTGNKRVKSTSVWTLFFYYNWLFHSVVLSHP